MPLSHRFTLGQQISGVQAAFFAQHGFLVFGGVAQRAELDLILSELEAVQARWIAEDRKKINGIPLFVGKDPDGRPFVQRFTFTSMFSEPLRRFVLDPRFEPVRQMVGPEARVGHDEHDGVVINRYINVPGSVYPRLGWHTDGLRDVAYLRKPQAMFNVGLHFDEISAADGGLRLIPGSHTQGLWDMAFRKLYFLDHRPDPAEIAVETQPGDLTVHDGRLWHRVAQSPHSGWRSLRRSMYVPYQTGPLATKAEDSPTPIYHTIGRALRWFKKRG
ncbi:MAG: phytanoyl-CoA dioxygenase family protein [Deltaproteobacteria bacterium]|nr:phytanoyl-CoA dioxygenase family protein [Deltaproteobacteria bacterium]